MVLAFYITKLPASMHAKMSFFFNFFYILWDFVFLERYDLDVRVGGRVKSGYGILTLINWCISVSCLEVEIVKINR